MQIGRSETMSRLAGIEDSLIRIPEVLRKELKVELGDIIVVKGLPLQVNKVFKQETIPSVLKAFVSENVIKKLGIPTHNLSVEQHITIGCDPELFLVDTTTNKLYNPGFIVKKLAPVGYDGMLAELRPDPDVNPDIVVDNIHKLLLELRHILLHRNLHSIRMVARSSGWNMYAGFHVHMGIPKKLLDPGMPNFVKILRVILKSLDYYVSTLAVIAEGNDFLRRCNPLVAYGKVGDFRIDNRTLEYRVPGGALLKHPDLTKGLLNLVSLVSHDVIERVRIMTNDFVGDMPDESVAAREIYPNLIDTQEMFPIICSPDTQKAINEFGKIQNDLSCMVNYDYYRDSLERFYNLLHTNLADDIWLNWSK